MNCNICLFRFIKNCEITQKNIEFHIKYKLMRVDCPLLEPEVNECQIEC